MTTTASRESSAGRAARHISGQVIFYADDLTKSMKKAINETSRRRELQLAYNKEHGIVPRGIVKSLEEVRLSTSVADVKRSDGEDVVFEDNLSIAELAKALEEEMLREAQDLNFEKAASLRDRLEDVRIQLAVEKENAPSKRRRHRGKSY